MYNDKHIYNTSKNQPDGLEPLSFPVGRRWHVLSCFQCHLPA